MTDIHLNFLDVFEREVFYRRVAEQGADCLFITGDIAEAPSVTKILAEMVRALNLPIYFVLGNHDYYFGNIRTVRKNIDKLCKKEEKLNWVGHEYSYPLSKKSCVVGTDGWADGRHGDYWQSHLLLNDSRLIEDLRDASFLGRDALLKHMQELADWDAQLLAKKLANVDQTIKSIIVLTHVPPFAEMCGYRGKPPDPDWLPFYSSKATGDVLLAYAKGNPEVEINVYCGHTHSEAIHQPLPNLLVKSGLADYSKPQVQCLFDVL